MEDTIKHPEFIFLILFASGVLILIFNNFFVDISSWCDWIFGDKFEKSMKSFRKMFSIMLSLFMIPISALALYPYCEKMCGRIITIIIYCIFTAGLISILTIMRNREQNRILKKNSQKRIKF